MQKSACIAYRYVRPKAEKLGILLDDLLDEVRQSLTFVCVEQINAALETALGLKIPSIEVKIDFA